MSLLIIQQGILGTIFLFTGTHYLFVKEEIITDETISSELENMFSIPYLNLELNVVRQVVNGYRGLK